MFGSIEVLLSTVQIQGQTTLGSSEPDFDCFDTISVRRLKELVLPWG